MGGFRPAKLMIERTPELREHCGIEVNAGSMVILRDGSRFEPVIGKPGDGSSPSCAIVDSITNTRQVISMTRWRPAWERVSSLSCW